MPDLIDEGSQQLGIWHPDDGHQDDGNKEEQGTSTAIKEERHDAESVNTQDVIKMFQVFFHWDAIVVIPFIGLARCDPCQTFFSDHVLRLVTHSSSASKLKSIRVSQRIPVYN